MLILIALTLTVLLGFCGLALDVGMMQLKKLQLQNAADAAALGAVYVWNANNPAAAWQAAKNDAALNGFVDGANGVTVAQPVEPSTGLYANNPQAVQVTVSQVAQPLFFPGLRTVSAQSVALAQYSGACLFLLSQSTNDFSLQVSTSTVTANCSTYLGLDYNVDDNSTATNGPVYVAQPNPQRNQNFDGTLTPQPQYNVPQQNDPLAYLQQPTPGTCSQPHFNINNASSYTLVPGTYCDLNITNSTVQMQPGMYIIEDDLNISHGSNVTGTGVTIFLASTAQHHDSNANIDNLTITLSAPTSTTGSSTDGIPGIVFFSDRSLHTGQNELQFDNVYAASKLDGIIYTPGQQVQFVDTPEEGLAYTFQANHYLGVVADQLYFTNSNITFSSDYSSLASSPFGAVAISLVQ